MSNATPKIPSIVQKENPVLRRVATPVTISEISSNKIKKIIDDMKKALANEKDGAAIAAPQIGVSLRIFVVSKKVLSDGTLEDLVCINPKISKLSSRKHSMEEGCLSVRWAYGDVRRSEKATIEAYDLSGKKFTRGGAGLLAQAFQHEMDHLDGILFIDKAKNVREMPPVEAEKTSTTS